MKIDIKFAEVHTPLFMGGVNHGVKLEKDKRGMKLVYDREHEELYIFHAGNIGIIPKGNVAIMVPTNPLELGFTPEEVLGVGTIATQASTQTAQPVHKGPGRPKAQVSHPVESAVFGTPR